MGTTSSKKMSKVPTQVLKNWKSFFVRSAFRQIESEKLKEKFKDIDKKENK